MPPAAEDPHTRTALAAYQAGALRWLAGGVIAVVLGVLMGVAAVAIAGSSGRRFPASGIVVVLVLVGAVGAAVGTGALLRAVRWRRALTGTPWRTGRLRIAGPAVIAFDADGDEQPVRLRLLSTAVWRTRAVQGLDGGQVRAAPVGAGQWVLTADGLDSLYGAREARRGR